MAPITTQNLNLVRRLSEFSEVRHIPETNSTTVLIDKKHFFEFSNSLKEDSKAEVPSFQSSFYTDHADYVEKAKLKLNSIWNSAQAPSRVTLETILGLQAPLDSSLPGKVQRLRKIKSTFQYTEYEEGLLTEKDVIRKIMNAKRIPARDPLKDINAMYGAEATGIIHPPSELGLPDMLVTASHFNKQSSWGAEDTLYVYLNLETPKGNAFVPVAVVTDNPKSVEWRRGVFSGTPAAQNIILFKKNQLRVQLQGNTLFAGWTKSIPLSASPYKLPPCCLVFEGQGDIKTCRMKSSITCGRTQVLELNWYDASVTFFHPSSKYSGPGTDGRIHRDLVTTIYPPK